MLQPQHDPVTFPVRNGMTVYNEAGYFKVTGIVEPINFTFDPQIKIFKVRLPKGRAISLWHAVRQAFPTAKLPMLFTSYGEDLDSSV